MFIKAFFSSCNTYVITILERNRERFFDNFISISAQKSKSNKYLSWRRMHIYIVIEIHAATGHALLS